MKLVISLLLSAFIASSVTEAAPFRVALLYPKSSADDMRCALEASLGVLRKITPTLELKSFAYGSDLNQIQDIARTISKEGYSAVIGPLLSHEALITAPVFSAARIPQFLPIATHPDLTTNFSGTVRMLSSAKHYAKLAAKFALSKGVKTSIVIVANESLPYSRTYRDEFSKQLRLLGFKGSIRVYNFIGGKADFNVAKKLIQNDAAAFVYAPIYAADLSALYFTLGSLPFHTNIFTHVGLYDARATLSQNYSTNVHLYFNGIWDQKVRTTSHTAFLKAAAVSCEVSNIRPWTMAAWDALELALAIHQRFPTLTGEAFALQARKANFNGILGPRKMDHNLEPQRDLPVFKLEKNRLGLETVVSSSDDGLWGDSP